MENCSCRILINFKTGFIILNEQLKWTPFDWIKLLASSKVGESRFGMFLKISFVYACSILYVLVPKDLNLCSYLRLLLEKSHTLSYILRHYKVRRKGKEPKSWPQIDIKVVVIKINFNKWLCGTFWNIKLEP